MMSAPPRGVLAVDKYFVLKSTCVTKKRLIRDKLYLHVRERALGRKFLKLRESVRSR